ncbi:hypothetical protein NC651_023584 [Populus alba x Populus x berolinensis]|nr:hypothetical protein NC651_023584 [Populus alba x Populus x berolinensis]
MLSIFLKEGLLKCALLKIFNKLKCSTTRILYFLVFFFIIYNKYFVFVLVMIFAYKHDIITCFLLLNV